MSNDLSNRSALVCDNSGANVETALRLSKEFGKVYYTTNFHRGFDKLSEAAPGMGFDEIEWVYDMWMVKPDLYVFPDCSDMALQEHLEESGNLVWGSRQASWLELKRVKFLETLKKVGLKVPEYATVTGVDNLRKLLESSDDEVYVKCSYWRGSCETHHHINMTLSSSWLMNLEKQFGGLRNRVPFVILEPIDAISEIGYDGYCVDGEFPAVSMMGIECKDKSYIGTVKLYADLPEPVKEVNEAFSPILKEYRYRNRFSTEIRVTESGEFYFLDPTMRLPSPAGESQLANEKNTGEIYWEGAAGNLVQPQYRNEFAVQVVMHHEEDMGEWRPLTIPKQYRRNVFLKYACKNDEEYWITPQCHDDIVGWVVGLGDTIEDAIDEAKEVAEALEGQSLKISTDGLMDSLKAVQSQEDSGLPFTDAPIPEPESVIDNG